MKTLDEFFDNVSKILLSEKFEGCGIPLFRGHSNGSYTLTPTLIRSLSSTDFPDIWTFENNLYSDFKALVGPRVKFGSSWETIFAMRHEGIPTRLLDWTENIGMSLFFALDPQTATNPHLWILNPYKLNEKNKDLNGTLADPEEDLKPYHETYANYCNVPGFECHDLPIAIYPRRTNDRIFAQRGLFTIHGKDPTSMENTCADCIERIDLTSDIIPKLRNVLIQFGINKYSVYPDFKGLGDYLKDKYNY
jgi:hypothetical protein